MITPANARALVRAHRHALRTGNRVAAVAANRLLTQYIEQYPEHEQTGVIFALMGFVQLFTSVQPG